jgi:hypothetical protein
MPKVRIKRAKPTLKAFPAIMASRKDFKLIFKKPTSIAKSAKGKGTGKKETRKTEKFPYFSINFSKPLILSLYFKMCLDPKKPRE